MKILIVEDDFSSRKILQSILNAYGSCDIAIDGEEAIFAFNLAYKENTPYDLILLDIMMPKMNGQQVLTEIRKIEAQKNIGGRDGVKIIMVTSLNDPKNIMDAFKAQCEGYVTKPIDKDVLIGKIRQIGLI